MHLTILGAGVPTPTRRRWGSSYLLEIGSESILVDCGPAATLKLLRTGRSPVDVERVFFTHHHFDHNADFPCFVLTRWDQASAAPPLEVVGPPPTTEFVHRLFDGQEGVFRYDWHARTKSPTSQRVYVNRGGTLPRPPLAVRSTDIEPGFAAAGEEWRVRAARTVHMQPYMESVAYRFESESGSVVFTGDTSLCDDVLELAGGAHTLVCMCWDHEENMNSSGEAPGQSGTRTAATYARDAGVERLILTHIGGNLAAPGSLERGVADVSRIYDGEVVVAEELVTLGF